MSAVSSPAPRGVETILVVDDDAWVRRFAVRALTSLGYRTIDVDSAAMALDEVARNAVDLLFSDIVMPGGINGHELAALLSETNPELKVLLTTGFNEEPNAGTAQEVDNGLTPRVLPKPYTKEQLAVEIRNALGAPR